MKKYNVTVNGVTYEVLVEEAGTVDAAATPAPAVKSAPAVQSAPAVKLAPSVQSVPAANTAPAVKPAPTTPASTGSVKVTAPMPGTIVKIAVTVGQKIAKGDLVCLLEAMKMENEIFAAEGGTVASIDKPQGSSVNSGDVIVTLS